MKKPILATMPGPDPLWNTYVEDYLPANGGTINDYRTLVGVTESVNKSKGEHEPAQWIPT